VASSSNLRRGGSRCIQESRRRIPMSSVSRLFLSSL